MTTPDVAAILNPPLEGRRLRQAFLFGAAFELGATALAVALLTLRAYVEIPEDIRFHEPNHTFILIATDVRVLGASFYFFIAYLQFMLFKTTPLASALIRTTLRVQRIEPRRVQISDDKSDDDIDEPDTQPTQKASGGMSEEVSDFTLKIIRELLRRSAATTQTAQWRPNVLLFVGALIAAGGLVFYVVTLPHNIDPKSDWFQRFLDVIPRLLMLLFIQVLAGFFLKQYRSSMEEFRYYESVMRTREGLLVGYSLYKSLGDQDGLKNLAQSVMQTDDLARLAHGQSTTIQAAYAASTNEFETLGRQMFELFASFSRGKTGEAHKANEA